MEYVAYGQERGLTTTARVYKSWWWCGGKLLFSAVVNILVGRGGAWENGILENHFTLHAVDDFPLHADKLR